jgi:hypothetical protein
VKQASIDAQRAKVTTEASPALYLATLFGSDDTGGMVRRITALIVAVMDPLAVTLAIAIAVV